MTALSPYRVLDLTTSRGWLTAKLLADLGADVIKVEPPGGDPGRSLGPFHGGAPDAERSLRWWFLNRGKRSVTLDLDTADGRALLRKLAATADVLIESFEPGYLDSVGLGFDALSAVNEKLVYTSITPFGQLGPHAHFEAPDIVLGSLGGSVWLTGDADRPPVRISVPQYEYHGAAEAAVHTTIALYHAAATGQGQHVDVAAQLTIIRTLMNAANYPVLEGRDLSRSGGARASSAIGLRMIYECKDGFITSLLGGPMGTRQLVDWMQETGDAPDWMQEFDWENTDFGAMMRSPEGIEFFKKVAVALEEFFANHTKDELYQGAIKRRLLLAPVNTTEDIRKDQQLSYREFFVDVDHGELGTVAYPGPWAKLSATPMEPTSRAPRIGEHTAEVLAAVGVSRVQLQALSAAGVV